MEGSHEIQLELNVLLTSSLHSEGSHSWSSAHAWKVCMSVRISGVRIPLPPHLCNKRDEKSGKSVVFDNPFREIPLPPPKIGIISNQL